MSTHLRPFLVAQDYGVKWSQTLDNGSLAVDNMVRVSLNLEAVKSGSGPKPESPKPTA